MSVIDSLSACNFWRASTNFVGAPALVEISFSPLITTQSPAPLIAKCSMDLDSACNFLNSVRSVPGQLPQYNPPFVPCATKYELLGLNTTVDIFSPLQTNSR